MSSPEQADLRPGSEASLDALYALVPMAEEVDLAEEVHAEQFLRWAEGLLLGRLSAAQEEPLGEADAIPLSDKHPDDSPTTGQALGLLEHLLGAVPIEE